MIAAMTAAIEPMLVSDQVSTARQVSTSVVVDTKSGKSGSRRRWPEERKRQIVAELLEPGASVSVVARQHDINANLLFTWRRRYGAGAGTGEPAMVAVELRPADATPAQSGTIEIDLPGGICVRVCGTVEAALLRQVFEVLR